jgi:hypothetical protein
LNIMKRRKLLIALAGGAALPALAAPAASTDDPLLAQARAWVRARRSRGERVVPYPVGRLQRTLRIGYRRTCALVDALAARGEWTIAYRPDGSRYALLEAGAGTTEAA